MQSRVRPVRMTHLVDANNTHDVFFTISQEETDELHNRSVPSHATASVDRRYSQPGYPIAPWTLLPNSARSWGWCRCGLAAFASEHGLAIVEDAAQAVGTARDGQPAGTVGAVGCFSMKDGKVEFLVSRDAGIVLADSPGTPDESRLLFNGVHCGKQVLRNWYVDNGLEVPVSKLIAEGLPWSRWPQPAPLPPEFLPVMSDLYRSLSETWTGERLWNAPDLPAATQAVTRLISQ
ncbi:DegT/DnrJ/EryC1/StrS family aminotransferase [Saccharopolyspora hattusasensis]|uniref:DegT/DnrJ/EryC1/StrS family aminotransferase n=1 Tax=Saccharopolyspora hattusasensis TaxID=1128679 RepID=UPI003D9533DA